MPLIYDGNKIIPAPPSVQIVKNIQTSADGTKVGSLFTITINGTLLAWKGSPNSTGTFWTGSGYPPDESIADSLRLKAILRKQAALRSLFATEGKTFEIQPLDGSTPLKCNPRIKSIEFAPGQWWERLDYTLVLEADVIFIAGIASDEDGYADYISEASEEWNIEIGDQIDAYRLTHTVSATGKRFYNSAGALKQDAWKEARAYVLPKLGLDVTRMVASGVLNLPSYYGGYNYLRAENVNELAGSYSVVESWVVASGSALEEFTVTSRTSQEDGKTVVTLEGTITGLETKDNNSYTLITERYTNAVSKYNTVVNDFLTRAKNLSGVTNLNPTALSNVVGRNQKTGVITYNYEFDMRPTNNIAGALSETINIIDDQLADIFASITVIGRTNGPVLQSIGTVTARRREVNIEFAMPAQQYGGAAPTEPNTNSLALSYAPTASVIFVDRDQKTWNPVTGRGSRVVSYTWES